MKGKTIASLSYLVTVSRAHLLPAQMLIAGLRCKTSAEIVVVGNLNGEEAELIKAMDVTYIDEDAIDMSGRLPKVAWQEKHRAFGWYKQMFIRLCIDRFMKTEQVVILDSEVFVFDNWDESRFYDSATKQPRLFYWVPSERKPEWDYKMYQGAAYLLSFLPECNDAMAYANSTGYHRHISGVVLFSTRNVAELWRRLEADTDLAKNIDNLFNKRDDLAFSDHDIYGIAAEYGLFDSVVHSIPYDDLLGWYENQTDPKTEAFKASAMWSMCQRYYDFPTPEQYRRYMQDAAVLLGKRLAGGTGRSGLWGKIRESLIVGRHRPSG